jgi:hypothetical protein
MKYIVFKRKNVVQPVVFMEWITHSEVSIGKEWKPVSAGFCYADSIGQIEVTNMQSESIGIGPNQNDVQLLNSFFHNMTIATEYIDFDDEMYPNTVTHES